MKVKCVKHLVNICIFNIANIHDISDIFLFNKSKRILNCVKNQPSASSDFFLFLSILKTTMHGESLDSTALNRSTQTTNSE